MIDVVIGSYVMFVIALLVSRESKARRLCFLFSGLSQMRVQHTLYFKGGLESV